MDAKAKYEKIKKAQFILLIPVGLGLIGMIVFGVLQLMDVFPLFAVITMGCGVAEAFLAVARKKASRSLTQSTTTPKHTSQSSGPNYHEPHQDYAKTNSTNSKIDPDDLPENVAIRKKIWKFDGFVRDNFPKLPLDDISFSDDEISEFKNKVNNYAHLDKELLKPIVDKMLKHLNQTFNYVSIEVRRIEPGQVKEAGHIDSLSHRIVVNYDGKMGYRNVLTLLAHEVSHAYQFYEFSKYPGEQNEIEEFTDFLTFYLGFGPLMERGYDYTYFDDKDHCEHKVRIGYLSDYALAFAKTTMNGRRTMKEMSLEEGEEIKAIKSKVKQTRSIIPEYLSLISTFIDNLTHCTNISGGDLTDIGRLVGEYQTFNIISVDAIVNRAVNEKRLIELRAIQKEMDKVAKQIFDLYMFFSQMSDKYMNL